MKLKHFITALLLIVAVNFTPAIIHAQETGPTGDSGDYDPTGDDPDNSVNVPFDGGVSLLVAAGVAYGLKKKHSSKKQLEEE